jgi:hypothetical protein
LLEGMGIRSKVKDKLHISKCAEWFNGFNGFCGNE